MIIRTFLVDDEAPSRRELRFLLEKHPDCRIVGEAGGGEEALDILADLPVDVLFLDIQMHDLDGLSVARQLLEQNRLPLVVFATAFDAYALSAFDVHALDYILKPFDPERLEATWRRVRERLAQQTGLDEHLAELKALLLSREPLSAVRTGPDEWTGGAPGGLRGKALAEPPAWMEEPAAPPTEPGAGSSCAGNGSGISGSNGQERHRAFDRVAANKEGKLLLVDVSKILYATVEGRKALIKVDGELLELNLTLQELEDRLDPDRFCRTHRAFLVNLSAIREIVPWFNGAYNLILHDKSEVPVSRHYARQLKDLLGL
ncbi:transcriptional regulator, lytr/algr family [Heliomicrobium modesticaldum Ice1]|uniref:Stage 0 sporulation protein A homolog n=1 Tax=Heliobacterium modesticaldum (strain ATCC 51547 / Ice1) TaxID=498761 RepID=B0TE50_HELMI|nr:LytTR family DNA-binding domain-containing protein [Heliomicrobium modesticaldum]ABZ84245.1 transcriptional regulator, lytr/algr family [Heliomicrobium modesticaldum Ice1]